MTTVTEAYDDEFEQPREVLQDNVVGCRIRLTAITNAADSLLRVVDDLVVDLPAEELARLMVEYGANIDTIRANLRAAINVARGMPDKLPRELFDDSAAKFALIRSGERLGLL